MKGEETKKKKLKKKTLKVNRNWIILKETGRNRKKQGETRRNFGHPTSGSGGKKTFKRYFKNPAYGRQSIYQPMRIVAPIPE